jgi:NTE family protein
VLGLVLSGGGARGAYEAGALRFLYDTLGPRLGRAFAPDVICGTSIGALTGAWVAARGRDGAVQLARAWQEMEPEHVYRLSWWDAWTLGKGAFWRETPLGAGQAFFDPRPLYQQVCGTLPWAELHARLDSGALRAFVVATTEVMTGRCVQFADGRGIDPRQTPTTRLVPARVGAEHCLASAALPLWFPSVRVGDRYYVDGSLRQNTPLLPAIALGAHRIVMVGVKRGVNQDVPTAPNSPPTPLFLAGKAFDALVLDDIEEDLREVEGVNQLLRWGQSQYPDFLARVQAHRRLRVVDTAYVRPDRDVGKLAGDCFEASRARLPWATRSFLSALHDREADENSDLLSYVYFDKTFTAELERWGYDDAARDEERLARMLMGEGAEDAENVG